MSERLYSIEELTTLVELADEEGHDAVCLHMSLPDVKQLITKTAESNITFVLAKLKKNAEKYADPQSKYADAILDFFDLSNRFYIHACVFKSMDAQLIKHIKENQ